MGAVTMMAAVVEGAATQAVLEGSAVVVVARRVDPVQARVAARRRVAVQAAQAAVARAAAVVLAMTLAGTAGARTYGVLHRPTPC
jgi:hypothetical protein